MSTGIAPRVGYGKKDFVATIQITHPDSGQALAPWRVTSWEGGGVTAEAERNPDWDGDYVTSGRPSRENVTTGLAWGRNPAVDTAELNRWCGRAWATLTKSRARNGVIVGDTMKFMGLLVGVSDDAGDPGASDGAVLSLEWAVDADLL